MNTKLKTVRHFLGCLSMIGLIIFALAACSTTLHEDNTPTPPTISPPANDDYYQFTLEKEFGTGIVEATDWAPDGSSFALATSLQVDIYDAQKLDVVTTLKTGQWNQEIAYSPNNTLLAIGGDDGTIQVWDLPSRQQIHSLKSTGPQPYYGNALKFSFSADGQRLVSAFYQTVYLWDVSTGALINSFPGHVDGIDSVTITPDGNTILAAGSRHIFVRDISSGKLIYPPIELTDDTVSVYSSQNSRQFYTVHSKYRFDSNSSSSRYDSTIRLWDASNGEMLEEDPIGTEQIAVTDLNPAQHALILAEEYGISIWDYSVRKEIFSLRGQTGRLNSLAISPDRSKLITVGDDFAGGNGLVQLWDLTTKQAIKTFNEYSNSPFAIDFDVNNNLVAIAGANRATQIKDLNNGQLLHTFQGGAPLAFSPDGATLALTRGNYGNEYLVMIDMASGEYLPFPTIPCPGVAAIAFAPDGQAIAWGGDDCNLQLRNAKSGDLIRDFTKTPGNEYLSYDNLIFSPDGKMLVLVGYRLKILDAQTGSTLLDDDSSFGLQMAAFSSDGRYLAIGGYGGYSEKKLIQVREVDSNQIALSIRTLQGDIKQMIFGSDGRTLLIAGESVELWDLWNGQPLVDVKLTDNPPVGIALLQDGQNLILVDGRGDLQHWGFQPNPQLALGIQPTPTYVPTLTATPDIPQIELAQIAELGKGFGSKVDYSPDGTIAAFVENNTLKWFDTKSLQEIGSMEAGEGLGSIIISPNNKIAVVDYIGAQVVDLEKQQVIGRVSGGNGPSFGYTFSKDSQFMAYTIGDRSTGGPYYRIGLWNVATEKDAFTEYDYFPTLLNSRYHTMSPPAISPDVKLVAAGHSDKRVYVWDLRTGETRFILEGHGAEVTSVDFSPNGRLLASGSEDGTIRLWDPSTGRLVQVITGFIDDISEVRFSRNGRSLRVLLSNEQEYLVNLSSYRITFQPETIETPDPFELQQYQQGFSTGTSSIFSEVLFSPDGKTLATASQNVLLWDVASHGLLTFLNNPTGGLLRGMVFNANSSQLAATTSDNHVLVWNTKTGEEIFSQKSNFLTGASVYYGVGDLEWGPARGASPVAEQGLAFAPSENLVAFGNDNVIEIWNVDHTEKIAELINPEGYFATRLSYSVDGQRLYAIVNRNRIAQIWDVDSAKLMRQINLPDVDANAFSAIGLNGPLFARNNSDVQGSGWIEIWNLEQDKSITIFAGSASNEPFVFSKDGSLLAAFGVGSELSIWKTSTGELVYQTRFDFSAGGLSISPNNKYLAVGHSGKASIFDFAPIFRLAGQPSLQASLPQATPTPIILAWPTPTAIPTSTNPTAVASNTLVIDSANATQVQEQNRFSKGTIEQTNWSPEGNSIVLTGSMGVSEYTVNPLKGTLIREQEKDLGGWAYNAIRLPDQHILATSVNSGRVYVWDVTASRILVDLAGGGQPALSPDGDLLVYTNPDGILEVWDILNDQSIIKLGSYSHISLKPVFSPDGQFVAAVQSPSWGWYNDSIRVWNIHTGEIVNALAGPDNDITDLSFSVDSQFMVGSAGGSAWMWDLRPGATPEKLELYQVELKDNLNIYTNTVTATALNPNNRILAIGTSEHTLRLYDRKSQTVLHELDGHASSIHNLRFSPDGQYLISVDQDGTLILWNVSSGKQLTRLDDHSGPIGGMLFQLDGNLVAWGQGTAWEINPSDALALHTTHIESSGSILAASPAGDLLAVYEPYQVSLWDAQNGRFIQTLEGEADDPFVEYYWEGLVFRKFYAAAFSLDGNHLVTAGTGGVWYYETTNRRLLQQYPGNNSQKITLSPDGQWMLTTLHEQANPVSVFGLQSGSVLFSLGDNGRGSDHPQSVFSPDGRWVGTIQIAWDSPYQLKIYDTVSKQEYESLPLGDGVPLTSLAFNPSGNLVAVGQADGAILLIDTKEMKVLTTLTGHHGAVEHLVFSPDGVYLVSSGNDGTVRTWGLR